MRDPLIVALLSLALITPTAAAATSPNVTDSSKTLVDDPYYITEGAVTSFRTCLGVANDHRAIKLWESDDAALDEARKANSRELVNELHGLERQVKLKLGFGTIYTCAQIADAWFAEGRAYGRDARMSGVDDLQDGRRQHGTVVIDLNIGATRYNPFDRSQDSKKPLVRDASGTLRGSIEAVPLIRILTSPRLLPPRDFGGVVIRNAEIDGTLLFYNVHLELPLAFANVRFRGHSYEKRVFGEIDDPPVPDTAIAIVNSRLSDHLQISASEICGNVRLIDSRFAESVSFRRVQQFGINCIQGTAKAAKPTLRINTSNFEQGLSTIQADFGAMHVSASTINSFASSRSQFGRHLWVTESDIGSFQINCSILAEDVDISYNLIEKDLFVRGSRSSARFPPHDLSCNEWWKSRQPTNHRTDIAITSNRIGGGLGLEELDGVWILPTLDANGAIVEPTINLASNRVGNGSELMLPAFNHQAGLWHGRVNLQGSTYEGRIEIGVDGLEALTISKLISKAYCPPRQIHEPNPAVIDLKAVRIRTLVWNLPFICTYRWSGYGLSYDLWLAGDAARESADPKVADNDQDMLHLWRESLSDYEPSSLNAMSDYLAGKGAFVDSRNVLLEAKRLNYAPACRPDSGLWECLEDIVFGHDPSLSEFSRTGEAWAEDGTDRGVLSERERKLDTDDPAPIARFQSAIMTFLLAPGGYGAKPEQALFFLALAVVVFFLTYVAYSFVLRLRLPGVPDLIAPLLSVGSNDPPKMKADEHSNGGLHDQAQSIFKRDDGDSSQLHDSEPEASDKASGTLEDLIDYWPDKDDWKDWRTEQRLHRIQEVLLPKIEACQKEAFEPRLEKLKVLRQKLERFGSTQTLGFSLFDGGKRPTRFTHWRYSIDTMVPFIDLHAYSNYYPESGFMRFISVFQHVIGWWLMTVFVASAAIL